MTATLPPSSPASEPGAPVEPARPRRTARVVALVVGVVVLGLAVLLATRIGNDPTYTGGSLVGEAVPTFDLRTLDGEPVRSSDLVGKTVVINFWNTWCIPCIEELPELKAFYERHRDEPDFAMIGVLRDEPASDTDVRAYDQAEGVAWTVVRDPDDQAAVDFGTFGQPETFVVGPDGIVAAEIRGPVTAAQLEQMVDRARGISSARGSTRRRQLVAWGVLALLVVGVLAYVAWPKAESEATRVKRIERELRCPTCQGLSIADSGSTEAQQMRREVARQIDAGRTDAQITEYFVDRYGEFVLLEPEQDGIGLLLWVVPVVVLVGGAVGLVFAIRRARPDAVAPATDDDRAIIEELRG